MSELNICPNCTGAGGDNNTWTCGMCGGTGGVPTASVDAEPTAWLYEHPEAKPLLRHSRFPMSVPGWTETPLYTEAQMQARADAARREGYEQAMCELANDTAWLAVALSKAGKAKKNPNAG